MSDVATIGIVTVGQGPRPDLAEGHRRRLAAAAARPVRVVERHLLDGLSPAAIRAAAARPGERSVMAPVRTGAGGAHPLGAGWEILALAATFYPPAIEAAVAELELEGAVATILACAAELPRSPETRRPLIAPRRLLVEHVRGLAASRAGPPLHVAAVVLDAHWDTDPADWSAALADVDVRATFVRATSGLAVEEAPAGIDLAVVLAYGVGANPADGPALAALEARLDAPVLLPIDLAAGAAARLVRRPAFAPAVPA